MWGIVEKVIDNNVYVVFENKDYKVYQNKKNLKICENNQVYIINDEIVEVKEYNPQLYDKIKALENKVIKKSN